VVVDVRYGKINLNYLFDYIPNLNTYLPCYVHVFHGIFVFCLFVGVTATAVVTAAAVNREV